MLSSLTKKILIIISGLLLVGYIIFAVIRFSDKPGEEICKGVNIQINDSASVQFIKKQDIAQSLNENKLSLIGKQINDIDFKEIAHILSEANPIINTIKCYHSPNGIVHIEITQRDPIMRIMSNSGDYYIDKDARIIPVSSEFTVFLPIATGFIDSMYAQTILCDFALFLKNNEFWTAQIEQIDVLKNKDVILIPRVGEHQILLGKLDDFESKLNHLMDFYQAGLSETGWNKYEKINLKFNNQIICTKKNGTASSNNN